MQLLGLRLVLEVALWPSPLLLKVRCHLPVDVQHKRSSKDCVQQCLVVPVVLGPLERQRVGDKQERCFRGHVRVMVPAAAPQVFALKHGQWVWCIRPMLPPCGLSPTSASTLHMQLCFSFCSSTLRNQIWSQNAGER
ncbi:hypothetical protein B0H17DRAFT_1129018 [Mycena rosella]|uniref:Secreted protein n=1 Tax=Mycena rosella TaxID=1033263 RepID=A0AAD7DUC4_MYCRO|nr:hypothetical protein B0H17DRAFT_1129018 [Mycena rosella]